MKNHLIPLAALLALGACNRSDTMEASRDNAATSIANTSASVPVGLLIVTFIKEAIEWDDGEIALGRLAESKGASQNVKDFGRMLVEDHTAHKKELELISKKAGAPVSNEASATADGDIEKLRSLSGAEFDKQFKETIIDHHTRDIKKYEEEAASGDAELAALAQKILEMLRKHLEAAKAL